MGIIAIAFLITHVITHVITGTSTIEFYRIPHLNSYLFHCKLQNHLVALQ